MKYPKTVVIHVTQDDITEAIRGSCCHCPIARAVQRRFRASAIVFSMAFAITQPRKKVGIGCDIPREATDFIERFDRGESVSPFSFKATQ